MSGRRPVLRVAAEEKSSCTTPREAICRGDDLFGLWPNVVRYRRVTMFSFVLSGRPCRLDLYALPELGVLLVRELDRDLSGLPLNRHPQDEGPQVGGASEGGHSSRPLWNR